VLGALVSIGPYIPDDWGWFLTMTVFGMGGGLAKSLVIGTVVGTLLIIAGKRELNASPIAWAVYASFVLIVRDSLGFSFPVRSSNLLQSPHLIN
jgi:hypothetical protein